MSIVFDIGNVVLNVDLSSIASQIASRKNIKISEAHKLFGSPRIRSKLLVEFECGRINFKQFYNEIDRDFGLPFNLEEFKQEWNGIFSENTETIQIISELFGMHRLYAASNTNETHLEYMKDKFPVMKKFDKIIASNEVGFVKPDPNFYKEVTKYCNAPIFIDDLSDNIEGAVDCGITSLLFKNSADLRRKLTGMGLL